MLLATKPMQLAQYFCTGEEPVVSSWRHYALAMDHYTHFTSPIRCGPVVLSCAFYSMLGGMQRLRISHGPLRTLH
jgi:L-lactate utilization protein LutB